MRMTLTCAPGTLPCSPFYRTEKAPTHADTAAGAVAPSVGAPPSAGTSAGTSTGTWISFVLVHGKLNGGMYR